MRLLVLIVITIVSLVFFSTSSLNAQSIFGFGPKKNDTPAQTIKTGGAAANQVLSPNEFNKKVNSLGQDTKTPAQQQVDQILNTKMPGPPPEQPKTESNTTTSTSIGTAPAPAPSNVTPSIPTTSAPAAAPSATSTLPPAPAPENKASQPQPYTGFGTGTPAGSSSTNSGTTNNPPASSGGWNIKY